MSSEISRVGPPELAVIEKHRRDVPVKISTLAQDLGLKILSSTLPAGIAGELRPSGSGFVVRVNRHDSKGRQRFTVAHEIAHFLLHRDHIGVGITDDVLYRSSLSDAREAEANRLAAEILMPADSVRRKLESLKCAEARVVDLAESFQVSEAAMRIRLESLGLL